MYKMNKQHQALADFALLMVTFVWGVTFVVVKEALAEIGPYYFLAIRFVLAALFLVLIRYRALRYLRWETLRAGTVIGIALFGGYAFQTVGLQYTSASNAGFITGLSVVLVPLMAAVLTRRLPPPAALVGVICATGGLALLSLQNGLRLGYGDALVLCCTICYAVHIMLVERYAPYHRTYNLAVVQIAVVGVISLAVAPFVETFPDRLSPAVIEALLATAIPATALAFVIQNAAQKFTSATHTAVIFTMEPVFAGLAAWLLGGETLGTRQLIGGAAIVLGMLVTVLGAPSGAGGHAKKSPADGEPARAATAESSPYRR